MEFKKDTIERIRTEYLNGILFGFHDEISGTYEWKWKSNQNNITYYLFGIYDIKSYTLEEATLMFIQNGAIGEYIKSTNN